MILSTPSTHSMYPQTGAFSFGLSLVLNTTSGTTDFGFSGEAGVFNIHFGNGRILDHNARFLGVYNAGVRFALSGVITPTTYDIYLNGQPRALGLPKSPAIVDTIYMTPSGTTANFSLYVNGDNPSYGISTTSVFQTGNAALVTGYIINESDSPFTVLSGSYNGDTSFSIFSLPTGAPISGSGAIVFLASGTTAGGYHSIPLNLYTSFGALQISLPVSGINTTPPNVFIYMNGITTFTNLTGPFNFTVQYGSFNGSPLQIVPIFSYLSGSGAQYSAVEISGQYSGTLSGFLDGSGWLSGNASISGTNGVDSGPISGEVSGFAYATGNFSVPFSIPATGQATGNGYSGAAIGNLTGLYNATITHGSITVSLYLTGSPATTQSLTPTGMGNATGAFTINSLVEGDLFWIGSPTTALAFPYTFSDAPTLTNYLNANTGLHLVTATYSLNVVHLTSVFSGVSGNGAELRIDQCNEGNSVFTGPVMTGGFASYAQNFTQVSPFSGYFNEVILASGNFAYPFLIEMTGMTSGINSVKSLTSIWTLQSGSTTSPSSMSPVPVVGNSYVGSILASQYGTLYLQLTYNNAVDSNPDIGQIFISGVNQPTGLAFTLSGISS